MFKYFIKYLLLTEIVLVSIIFVIIVHICVSNLFSDSQATEKNYTKV